MEGFIKSAVGFLVLVTVLNRLEAQDLNSRNTVVEQQLEDQAEKSNSETEDDSHWQELKEHNNRPLNLNTIGEEELRSLGILTDLQVSSFFQYRKLLGTLINIYELQAIPGWDKPTILGLLPFVEVAETTLLSETFSKRLKGGEKTLLVRLSRQLELARGYEEPKDSGSSHFLGSPQKIFFRYKYTYKNLLQYGFSGDKDAGEPFFIGRQRYGFDFYSFHLFLRKAGIVQSLAIGDFTVNLGQGLIQWQTQAFTKSADVLAIKRQSSLLRPYNSAGEFYFHRGAGIELAHHQWRAMAFVSCKKIGASLDADTLSREAVITSFQDGGYHRTANENADRNNIQQITWGGSLQYKQPNYQAGLNVIDYRFSNPIQKKDEPYNLFAIQGRSWYNASIDYSTTYNNLHFFGEWALDRNKKTAWLNGLLLSVSSGLDLSIVYRNIDRAYQPIYANAFTENSSPGNERGLYLGVVLHPPGSWRISAFMDQYSFPWLKYQVAAPSFGRDYLVQVIYQPGKKWNISITYKNQLRQANAVSPDVAIHFLEPVLKKDCRVNLDYQLSRQIILRSRLELVWYGGKPPGGEQGFLALFDFFYRFNRKPYALNMRLQYFETGGYNSRIYAFESSALYNYSLPEFSGKGFRYYVNASAKFKRPLHIYKYRPAFLEFWTRWSQTIYPANMPSIGTGLDEIKGNKKSNILLQILITP